MRITNQIKKNADKSRSLPIFDGQAQGYIYILTFAGRKSRADPGRQDGLKNTDYILDSHTSISHMREKRNP